MVPKSKHKPFNRAFEVNKSPSLFILLLQIHSLSVTWKEQWFCLQDNGELSSHAMHIKRYVLLLSPLSAESTDSTSPFSGSSSSTWHAIFISLAARFSITSFGISLIVSFESFAICS